MKKLNKRILEARMQDMLNQPTEADMAQLEETKARAYAEYQRRQDAQAHAAEQKAAHQKSRRLRTAVVCALAAAFLVLPLVYTILMPVSVSNANHFVRKATIWINDTLHLNIEIDEPLQEEGEITASTEVTEVTFTSFEEAEAYLGERLLVLDCEGTGLELESIAVTTYPENIQLIVQQYMYGELSLLLRMKGISDSENISPDTKTEEISTSVGKLLGWSNEENVRALGIIDKWFIQLKSSTDKDTAFEIFKSLAYFN